MLLGATFLLPLSVLVVITTAGLVPAHTSRIRRGASIAAPLAVLPALVLALTGPGATLELDWLLLGTTLRLDELTRPLTLLTALLYGAALAAVAWLRADDREPRDAVLSAFLLASYTGNSQVLLAADTVGFYLGFTLMSFSAAGLVIHRRTAAAHRATVIYLVMSVISETSLLAALLLTVHAGGSLLDDAPAAITASGHTGLILALLLIGFGIKAGTILLHVWLPLAHPAAPPAASAVLSGAMVKAGLVGWLRFLPMGATESDPVTAAAWVLLALSLAGAFLAAPSASCNRTRRSCWPTPRSPRWASSARWWPPRCCCCSPPPARWWPPRCSTPSTTGWPRGRCSSVCRWCATSASGQSGRSC